MEHNLSSKRVEVSVDIDQPDRSAIDWLHHSLPELSKNRLKQAMQYGCVWLEDSQQPKRIRQAKKKLNIGAKLHIYFDETILFSNIEAPKLIADEGDYSIWNKPCGMLSQGTKWGDHSSIARWVELNYFPERPCFLVHRLDRATQGLIIVAHKKRVASQLTALFEKREIEKYYRATVKGEFPDSIRSIDLPIDEREALTKIVSNEFNTTINQTKLLLKIETGRKHQIRKHLQSIGFPIIGDRLYGNASVQENSEIVNSDKLAEEKESSENPTNLMLQSCRLSFDCPVTNLKKVYHLEQK